ncbi:MAG: PucR family transcriptional regulator [Pseudomonadota bacterium]
MRYNQLISILYERFEIKDWRSDNSQEIMDIRLLDGNEQHWSDQTLYVGSLSSSGALPDKPIMVISTDRELSLPEGSSCARIKEEDIYGLFNIAKDLIFEELREGGMFFELSHMALSGKSLAYVINSAATLLGNALILVDLSQKVLAYSTNYEIADPLWAQNIERGYCSYEFVQKVRSNKDMKEWSKGGQETQVITLPGDRQPKLVARIVHEGHVVGSVIMIAHHAVIGRGHRRQLPLIGKILFDVFNRDSASGTYNGSIYSTILYNLLDEEKISDDLENIVLSKVNFPQEMKVVVARFVHRLENRYLKRTFGMELERIFPKGYSVQFKSYIIILVPDVSEEQKAELERLAGEETVSIGISWPFADIIEFKRHFNQAVASIKQAQRFGINSRVFDYENYYFYDLLYNYSGRLSLKDYCHPSLQILRGYDRENNTELYITLRTFLECNKNHRTAAEALFIHRNSLMYRLNRIQQLTKLDLNNSGAVNSLMDSFRIETFMNL